MNNKEYRVGPFPLSIKPTMLNYLTVILPPVVLVYVSIQGILQSWQQLITDGITGITNILIWPIAPVLIFFIFYLGGVSRYLSIYLFSNTGITIKLPLRKSRLLAWDSIQEICIQDDLYSKAKGYTKCICIVAKGETKSAVTGKWKATGVFNYNKVLTIVYSNRVYEEIARRCPPELLCSSQKLFNKTCVAKDDNNCVHAENAMIFKAGKLGNAIFLGIMGMLFLGGCITSLYFKVFDWSTIYVPIALIIFSLFILHTGPLAYFRKYIFSESGISLQTFLGTKHLCDYSEILLIKKNYLGDFVCYSKEKMLFVFSPDNEEMVAYLKKKLPADVEILDRL